MDNRVEDGKISDEYLYKTVPIAAQELVDETETYDDIHVSEEFDKRMQKYFNKLDRKSKLNRFNLYAKRVCVSFIVVVFVAGVSVMSVDAWRVKLFNMLTNRSETNTEIRFQNDNENKFISDEITLNYLPTGFQLLENNCANDIIYLSFINGDKVFDVVCSPIQSALQSDPEEADSKSIKINNSDAVLTNKNGIVSIVWNDSTYSYSVAGNLNEDELVNIATNVEK